MNLELRSPFDLDYPSKYESSIRDGPVRCISFNKRGTMLAGGCSDGYCIVWDFQSMSVIRKMKCHVSSITSVSWSRNGLCILSCGEDNKCVYWDLKKGTQKWIRFDNNVIMAQMHPKNNSIFVASLSQESPVIVEIGDTIKRYPLPTNADTSSDTNINGEESTNSINKTVVCRYDKRGTRILSGTSKGYLNVIDPETRKDKTIRLYWLDEQGIHNSELQFAETVNKNSWNQCCFSQGGEYVIGATHQIFIWDIRTTRLVQTLQGPYENLVDLAQHPVQPIIVSVDEQGTMHTWTTRHKEDWVNWDPAFTEIHDNIVYEEREDEFDIVNEEVQSVQYNKSQKFEDEDEEIDVVTIDRTTRSDSSDYEDEFINLYDSEVDYNSPTEVSETKFAAY
ncbi:18980_t:CDS:2 [Racocetra persica]|uniref:18980_t:CDS:1 n=1 Tax=Racocetra persica TaxID=160502 RepID=A0ACA9LID1_9GLOM|nr:18980_t:CDS:2 [Racocetra persica]